jgi:lipopolysaccharide biosynthesis regulator YciM
MAVVRLVDSAAGEASGVLKATLLAGSGAALYRAGRYQDAIARLQAAERRQSGYRAQIHAFLAMANQALGRKSEARRWLDQLRVRTSASGADPDSFWANLEIDTLSREAEALLLEASFPANPFSQ